MKAIKYLPILLILGSFSTSCNPVKRVLADIDKVKEVRTATDALFPCLNDTTIYSTDTLTEIKVVPETTYDTTIVNDTVYLIKTVKTESVKTVTVYRDKIVRDTREEKRLQGDLALSIQRTIQAQQGEIKALEGEEKQRKRANNLMWILIAIGAISVTGVILKLKKVF
jgi:hypothetical protein